MARMDCDCLCRSLDDVILPRAAIVLLLLLYTLWA